MLSDVNNLHSNSKEMFFYNSFVTGKDGENKQEPVEEAHQHHEAPLAWESILDISPDTFHNNEVEEEDDEKGFLNRLAAKIKSVDGIDETASLVGQILPNLAGSLASGSILAVATPFVWLGVSGMREEYQEAFHEFSEIAKRQESTRSKLNALVESSQKWRSFVAEKCGAQFASIPLQETSEEQNLEEAAGAIIEHQTQENKIFINSLARRFGWTGIAGMAGMMGGMILGTGAAATEIAIHAGETAAGLETAAKVLEIGSGGMFLPSQLAMAGYAWNRKRQGERALKVIEEAEKTFRSEGEDFLSKETLDHVVSIISKRKNYIMNHSIKYGSRTVVGQGFMMTGTALGLSGIGLPGTVPAFALGAPLTIYPAIHRIVNQEKEQSFRGTCSDFVRQKLKHRDPISMFSSCGSNYIAAFKQLEEELRNTTERLAAIKTMSLLHHVVNDRSPLSRKDPIKKFRKLLERLDTSKKQGMKGSELEKAVTDKVRSLLTTQEKNIQNFITQDVHKVNQSLLRTITIALEGEVNHSFEMLWSPAETPIGQGDFETLQEVDVKLKSGKALKEKKLPGFTRKALTGSKKALKAVRFALADSMVGLAQIKEMADLMRKDCVSNDQQTGVAMSLSK